MEQNKEMTPQESLSLISETLNNNRKDIMRRSGRYYILWGCLLAVLSVVIYALWKGTEKEVWNMLWFAMPLIGYPAARWMRKKEPSAETQNEITRITHGVWTAFGIMACSVAAFTLVFSELSESVFKTLAALAGLTAEIVLLFGFAECVTGVALKNWIIKIAGIVTGIGGLAIYYITGPNEEQLFIFTFTGLVLAATGLIVKSQYK